MSNSFISANYISFLGSAKLGYFSPKASSVPRMYVAITGKPTAIDYKTAFGKPCLSELKTEISEVANKMIMSSNFPKTRTVHPILWFLTNFLISSSVFPKTPASSNSIFWPESSFFIVTMDYEF
ncbi:hypothetical protein [Peijinzhouia sedimentorum]